MGRYISILRGINVGGNRKILMADLKKVYEKLGLSNIITFIQSGNVIFDFPEKVENAVFEQKIQQAIKEAFDFDVPVIIRSKTELQNIIENNPFKTNDGEDMPGIFVTFLKLWPTPTQLEKIAQHHFPPDDFIILGNNVYLSCSGNYSKSKLTNQFFEKNLKSAATTRNWNTICKLNVLSSD
ncbi:MAG: DUF1697 domain-containing protein [Bacteroidales bacterium]|jgi:uncharacterized protein (DUF1697 family)